MFDGKAKKNGELGAEGPESDNLLLESQALSDSG